MFYWVIVWIYGNLFTFHNNDICFQIMYIKLFLHFIHNSVNRKKLTQNILYNLLYYFFHKMQENLNFNRILNSKDVKS